MKRLFFSILLLLSSLAAFAQPGDSLSLQTLPTGLVTIGGAVTDSSTFYQFLFTFSSETNRFSLADVTVGKTLVDNKGDMYLIQSVDTTTQYDLMQVVSLESPRVAPNTGAALMSSKTDLCGLVSIGGGTGSGFSQAVLNEVLTHNLIVSDSCMRYLQSLINNPFDTILSNGNIIYFVKLPSDTLGSATITTDGDGIVSTNRTISDPLRLVSGINTNILRFSSFGAIDFTVSDSASINWTSPFNILHSIGTNVNHPGVSGSTEISGIRYYKNANEYGVFGAYDNFGLVNGFFMEVVNNSERFNMSALDGSWIFSSELNGVSKGQIRFTPIGLTPGLFINSYQMPDTIPGQSGLSNSSDSTYVMAFTGNGVQAGTRGWLSLSALGGETDTWLGSRLTSGNVTIDVNGNNLNIDNAFDILLGDVGGNLLGNYIQIANNNLDPVSGIKLEVDDANGVLELESDGTLLFNQNSFPSGIPSSLGNGAGTYVWTVNQSGSLAGTGGWTDINEFQKIGLRKPETRDQNVVIFDIGAIAASADTMDMFVIDGQNTADNRIVVLPTATVSLLGRTYTIASTGMGAGSTFVRITSSVGTDSSFVLSYNHADPLLAQVELDASEYVANFTCITWDKDRNGTTDEYAWLKH